MPVLVGRAPGGAVGQCRMAQRPVIRSMQATLGAAGALRMRRAGGGARGVGGGSAHSATCMQSSTYVMTDPRLLRSALGRGPRAGLSVTPAVRVRSYSAETAETAEAKCAVCSPQ